MGAQIEGEGTSTIEIQGVDRLHGATHPVVTDRIELGTYMLAPAIAGGEVECLGGRIDLVRDEAGKPAEAHCHSRDGWRYTGLDMDLFRKLKRRRTIS